MVRYKNIGDKEYQNCKDVDNLTNNTNEEFIKYKNVLIGDIIKFGLNRHERPVQLRQTSEFETVH